MNSKSIKSIKIGAGGVAQVCEALNSTTKKKKNSKELENVFF
jgi:hypothetical protein